jgi:hypothetical protein
LPFESSHQRPPRYPGSPGPNSASVEPLAGEGFGYVTVTAPSSITGGTAFIVRARSAFPAVR